MTTEIKKLKEKLLARTALPAVDWDRGLSTGSTLLNLACSGRPTVGLLPGHFYMLVGDSQAGKTWVGRQILAEAAANPVYKNHRLIHTNPERGALMEVRRYFGAKLAARLEEPEPPVTLEAYYDWLDGLVKSGKSFVNVLDSEDALVSEAQLKKRACNKKARRDEDGRVKGSYGDGKAVVNSSSLRLAHSGLAKSGSILVMIKQTRDNIGFNATFNPKTRSGGRALTFYATLELWFSLRGKIRKNVLGKSRTVGSYLRVQVKKNRIDGNDAEVVLPFYKKYGIDDLGAMIDFLVDERHWTGKGNADDKKVKSITAPEFGFEGPPEKLARQIEEAGQEQKLRMLTAQLWRDIQDACALARKPRYE